MPWLTLAVIATGGVIGALTRLGIETAFPHRAWLLAAVNVTVSIAAALGAAFLGMTIAHAINA